MFRRGSGRLYKINQCDRYIERVQPLIAHQHMDFYSRTSELGRLRNHQQRLCILEHLKSIGLIISHYNINLYLAKISLIWCIGSIRIWIFPPSGTCSILKSYLRTPYLRFSSFRWKDRIDWVSASWLSSTSREKLQLNRNEWPFSVKSIQNRK